MANGVQYTKFGELTYFHCHPNTYHTIWQWTIQYVPAFFEFFFSFQFPSQLQIKFGVVKQVTVQGNSDAATHRRKVFQSTVIH